MALFPSIVDLYHNFNRFLGSDMGEFYKQSIELVVLVIITYMIISEYMVDKQRQLKYLSLAFVSLLIQKLVSVLIYSNIVFGKLGHALLRGQLSIVISSLEIFALILIANAFVFPVFESKRTFLRQERIQIYSLAGIFIAAMLLWNVNIYILDSNLDLTFIFVVLEVVKILVLLAPIYFLFTMRQTRDKYTYSVMAAFVIYIITPIITIINLLYFQRTALRVLANPFPIIAVLLFTRAIFLKLVDKASLRQKLNLAKTRYYRTQEISKMKDEFISIISHELRTPITSIKLYLSLLLEGRQGSLTEEQKETLRVVKEESNRLSGLITDVLDLSKLENRKVQLRLKKVRLRELVEESTHKVLAEHQHINVHNETPPDMEVFVDPDRFRQVIVNLYGNAVKYNREGGSIWLGARKSASEWEFSIRDNGIGIEKSKLPRLFDKFYQAESYLTRQKGGTGLGLAIVKHIVDLHKGRIQVKSRLGSGSTFTVQVPNRINVKRVE